MQSSVKDQALRLISENLGEVTAKSYAEFYKDKDDVTIKESVNELLTEVIGDRKASEVISELNK